MKKVKIKKSTIKRRGVLVPASLLKFERQDNSNLPVVLKTVLADYFDIRGRCQFIDPLLPPNFYRVSIGFNYLSAIMAITYHKIFRHGFLLSNAFKVRPIGLMPILNYKAWYFWVVSTLKNTLSVATNWVKKTCQVLFSGLGTRDYINEYQVVREQFCVPIYLGGLT